jgi:hypothetical protein
VHYRQREKNKSSIRKSDFNTNLFLRAEIS